MATNDTQDQTAPAADAAAQQLTATCPRKELFEGIQIVGKAVAARTSLPILTHVRIAVDDGRVSLMATDLEMWMKHTLPTPVLADDAAATAPARNFTELLGAMPEADVTLTVDSATHKLGLRCNKANYHLLGLPAEEFPMIPQVADDSRFHVDRATLRAAIRETIFATSPDETRVILTGVLLAFQGDSLRMVATDTHRLTLRDCEVKEGLGSASAIVPARVMSELLRIAGGDDGDVTVTLSGNQIQFHLQHQNGGQTTLISRLIDGQFPNYERVIPSEPTRVLTIQREEFISAIRRAAIVARENQNRVVTKISDDGERLVITAESGNIGNAYEEVDVASSGSEEVLQIAFNAKYLMDVLGVLETQGLNLELWGPLRPGVIRPTGQANYLCVLMPMQVV